MLCFRIKFPYIYIHERLDDTPPDPDVGAWLTLVLGIELGIDVAVGASVLVVFARMSRPRSAVLGRIGDTATYRNSRGRP